MAGDKADEPQQAPPDAVSDEFVDVEPIPIVVLGIIASGLVAALLVAIGELITETAPGLQLLFGAAIIILVLSTGWLLSAIQGRHRYVDAVTSRALDLAAKALSSNSAP